MKAADLLAAAIPQPEPGLQALENCKIISHRGEHNNIAVMENTLSAFANARDNHVWGIEFDVQWTADLVPVVSHDDCGTRVFGQPGIFGEMRFAQLRARLPQVPTLAEVVDEFGGNTHLMVEIKSGGRPQLPQHKAILSEHLGRLCPGRDYHFLALDPALFSSVDFVSRRYCIPVAELNIARLSEAALENSFGGLSGHFYLLSKAVQKRHELAGQRIGVGFVSSKNSLFRELNRGVEWIFSNDAVKIQKILDGHLR